MLVFGSVSLVETSDGTFYYLLAMGSVEEVFSKIHHRKRRIGADKTMELRLVSYLTMCILLYIY